MSHLERTTSVERHRLARDVRNRQVVLDDTLARVDEHEHDVCALGSLQSAELRVVLDPLPLLLLAPKAGRVDEDERPLAALQHGVDRVAGRPRLLGDDHPLLAEECVQKTGLARIRAPEDRHPDRVLARLGRPASGQARHDRIEEVARAVTVNRREGDRVAEAKPVELQRIGFAPGLVDLVRDQEDRLVRVPQDRRQLLVAGRDAGPGVDDEQDEVGFRDRGAGLLCDLLGQG